MIPCRRSSRTSRSTRPTTSRNPASSIATPATAHDGPDAAAMTACGASIRIGFLEMDGVLGNSMQVNAHNYEHIGQRAVPHSTRCSSPLRTSTWIPATGPPFATGTAMHRSRCQVVSAIPPTTRSPVSQAAPIPSRHSTKLAATGTFRPMRAESTTRPTPVRALDLRALWAS